MSSWQNAHQKMFKGTNLSRVSIIYYVVFAVFLQHLCSVFLRELEYYQGIIFLTTNLYETIDTAFRSRVNIHLLFSPLAFSARTQLWRKFLTRMSATEDPPHALFANLSESDINQLAAWELNGREIKNAIKTVRTWCLCKGYQLSLPRFESGIMVTAPQAGKVEGGAA